MELHPFNEYAKMFLERMESNRVPKNTLKTYDWAVHKHLIPYWGSQEMDSIKQKEVDLFKTAKMKLSAATVNLLLQVLSGILKLAKEYGAVDSLPVMHCLAPHKNEHYLTEKESIRLLSECSPKLYVMVALALTTGLRRENIFNLKWDEIDDNILTVKVKRGKTLSLPLSPQMIVLLEQHRRFMIKRGEGDTEWVFPRPSNYKVAKSDSADGGLNRAFKKAELPYSGWHILRHTFATSFLKSVGNLVLLQNILGHSDIAQTARYAHIDMGQKKKALEEHANRSLPVMMGKAIAKKPQDVEKFMVDLNFPGSLKLPESSPETCQTTI